MSLVASQSAQAGIITRWDFTTAATGPLSSYADAASFRDTGISATPGLTTSLGLIVPNVVGGVLNYTYGGNHAAYLDGCTFLLALTASTANYSGLSVTFADAHSGGLTALSGQWSYWVGVGTPGNFAPIGSAINLMTTPANTSLGGITVSANQTLELRFVLSGAAGTPNGTVTFDTLDVSATGITPVPEPVHYALAVFGVIFVGTGVGRWYHGRMKRA